MIIALINYALQTTSTCHGFQQLPEMNMDDLLYIHGNLHCRFTGNYGVLGVLDRLHDTDKVFRESSRFDKHRLIFSAKALT